MMNALFTAATGMDAQQTRIAVISNNLANMTTTGFKQGKAVFQDLLYQTITEPGAENSTGVPAPSGLQIGTGTKVVATPAVHSQGISEQTGRELDVMIEGSGFLQVSVNGQTFYTRAGSLSLGATGNLVTESGYEIQPTVTGLSGAQSITIGEDGTISALVPPATQVAPIANLQLSTFPNPSGLKSEGRNLYSETPASGTVTTGTPGQNGAGTIRQGFLESSNVNVAEELIKMVLAQRAFEMNSKVIRTADDMMSATNQIR